MNDLKTGATTARLFIKNTLMVQCVFLDDTRFTFKLFCGTFIQHEQQLMQTLCMKYFICLTTFEDVTAAKSILPLN